MNLLFITSGKISPIVGGTEHTTLTVASSLSAIYRYRCFALYSGGPNIQPEAPAFVVQRPIPKRGRVSFLEHFISENKIDVVLSQGNFGMTLLTKQAIDRVKLNKPLLIFVHHFTPGWEENHVVFSDFVSQVKNYNGKLGLLCSVIKLFLFPIYRIHHLCTLRSKYHDVYCVSNRVVLLTESYKDMYVNYGKIKDSMKFVIIPNALSFPQSFEIRNYHTVKSKTVLIVARMDEIQKRISLALKIWMDVKKHEGANDWQLQIAGSGPDYNTYVDYVKKMNLIDVCFVGQVNPEPYYLHASIFMMTSKSEGFPLTLNESMQYGVVPIAFGSFMSISEIIDNGSNGYIINEGNLNDYSQKLLLLMQDNDLRMEMAANALKSVDRYTPEKVSSMWNDLLLSLQK